jgi:hypothetical protein
LQRRIIYGWSRDEDKQQYYFDNKVIKGSEIGISSNGEIADSNGLVKNMMSSSFKLIRNKST